MRNRPLFVRVARLLPAAAVIGLVVPLAGAQAATPIAVSQVQLLAPSNVSHGAGVDLRARLTAAGVPLVGRDLSFVTRPAGSPTWRPLTTARTGFGGWAQVNVAAVSRPTDYGVSYAGFGGLVGSRMTVRTVHVVDVVASAPARVRLGHPVRLAGRVTLDGVTVPGKRLHFLFRPISASRWQHSRWARTDDDGWAEVSSTQRRSFQAGVRFEGAPGLAPSPLRVARVRVVRPTPPPGFVFPFASPSIVDGQGLWTQDDGVDVGTAGDTCGRDAILVAVGDGVVIQEGIDGFGPTAPVLRMTSGVFKGRNVYYGHTGRDFVQVGDHVKAGQRLTTIGCGIVGQSSAPHLEIGVGVAGGPPCCPGYHVTSAQMWRQLVKSDPR